MELKRIAEFSAGFLEILGIGIIVSVAVYSSVLFLYKLFKNNKGNEVFRWYRHMFGKGILLGLEFLVGSDIIHTVAVDLSYKSIGVLAIIVMIRTFLSFTLELEIAGKWPWQK